MKFADVHDPLERLVKLLTRLPGVGERTARRLALFVLKSPPAYAEDLARALLEVQGKLRECSRCGNISEQDLCPLCSDNRRDATRLCVVSSMQDLTVIERSGAYHGRYHILDGCIAPLEGRGPDDLDTDRLVARIREEGTREVILATNPTVEGDATAGYLAGLLRELDVRVTRIASGIQHGGEIEYSDPVSVARAMDKRTEY
jgi:recombination protein RecR